MSPIPLVHTRTAAAPSPSGGNYRRPGGLNVQSAPGIPGTLLLIKPKDRFHIEEGFGVTAPRQERSEPPPLRAQPPQFIEPDESPSVEMCDASTSTEIQILFKKEMDGLKSYQEWISNTVDPVIRVHHTCPLSAYL